MIGKVSICERVAQEEAPSWLKNPDYERMGWVNDVIVHLWPHVAAAASTMVREMAEPLLQQSKPKCAHGLLSRGTGGAF